MAARTTNHAVLSAFMAPRDHFRAHGRMPVRINALLRTRDKHSLAVIIRDMGFGGAGIELAEQPTATSAEDLASHFDWSRDLPVEIEIVTPVLWDPLVLPGKIVWNSEPTSDQLPRAGIRFEPLGATALLSLFDVLGSN